jgi:holo-[acyl-carrier protein] synthase
MANFRWVKKQLYAFQQNGGLEGRYSTSRLTNAGAGTFVVGEDDYDFSLDGRFAVSGKTWRCHLVQQPNVQACWLCCWRMIIGLGSDLCNIERIQNSLDRFGERFENRVFTEVERAKAARRPFTRAGTYAKRFAAKEAFSKAVGTGFKRGVFMKDIGVVNAPSGAPTLALTGGAKARLDAMVPNGYEAHIHLTLTDDHPWAQAFVIIEALPKAKE